MRRLVACFTITRKVLTSTTYLHVRTSPYLFLCSSRLLSSSTQRDEEIESLSDESDDNWIKTFNELKIHLDDLRRDRGLSNSDPAPFPTEKHLINWISKLRFNYKNGRFGGDTKDEDRIDMLESIGGE